MMLALMVFVARCIQYVRDAVKGGADDGRIEPPAPEREPKRRHLPSVSQVGYETAADENKPSFEDLEDIARFIQQKTSVRPTLGVICGSGLGGLAEDLDQDRPKDVFSYSEIPNFPVCRVKGHAGNLVFGYLAGQPTVCMQGRFHFYEGHPSWKITMPVRVLQLLGVEILIVTNASGGLNENFNMGDIMILSDHINMIGMTGFNPLVGENEDRFGPRFPAMTSSYDRELIRLTKEAAQELGMAGFVQEGVYVSLSGPSYETPAESRLLRLFGADSVGMSTAPEVVVAKHCGMRVLGISLITNKVIMSPDSTHPPPTHQEVMDTANRRAKDLQLLVKTVVHKVCQMEGPCRNN